MKPLFIKTYGRQMRKVSTWLSPENRKQAFDSTLSSDGDISVFEPSNHTRIREKKTSGSRGRGVRPAKKKATVALKESSSDEENKPSFACTQQSKTTREKKTSGSRGRGVRPAKKKAMLALNGSSSDEENKPSFTCTQQSKTTRKTHLVSVPSCLIRQEVQQFPRISESKKDSTSTTKCQRDAAQMEMDSSIHSRCAGRFVTHRRRTVAAKPKLPEELLSLLNSSDSFTSGAFGPGKVPPTFLVSIVENSVNAATNSFRETSLNDHSLGRCPRKPIFCSTPSAGPLGKRPQLQPISINNQSAAPPSMSVSCIDLVSTFLDSPPRSPPPIVLHSDEKLQSSFGEREPSGDLFMETRSTNGSEKAEFQSEDIKTKSVEELQSLNLLSTDDSESNSRFVLAAEGLEWLIEALKERCLTKHCSVRLEGLYNLNVTQRCSQTTYSSCLGQSSSVHSQQTSEHSLSVESTQNIVFPESSEPSFNHHLFVSHSKTSDYSQSNSTGSSEHPTLVTDSQESTHAPLLSSDDREHSAEDSSSKEAVEQLASVLHNESAHHTDGSLDFIMDTHLPSNSAVKSKDEAAAIKDRCYAKKCTVQLKRLSRSQLTVEHLKGFMQRNDNVWACDDESAPVYQKRRKCLNDKPVELKEIPQLKGGKLKACPAGVSDSESGDHTMDHHHQSESDANHCNEDAPATRVNRKKRGSTSPPEESISNVTHKRKKTSPQKKQKKGRTSTDRPGTTRKASVSGLSTRWKNRDCANTHRLRNRAAQPGGNRSVDCSINELIPTQDKQPRELLGTTMNFSTPVRPSRHSLLSLLADFTPNTQSWSRLKAALSVHRKVQHIQKSSSPWVPLATPRREQLADVSQDLFSASFGRPLYESFRSQLVTPNTSLDADLSDAEKVYAECGQPSPLTWEECILRQRTKQFVKIGEGTFGEVFSTTNASGDTVALKVIPVEGSEQVNGEDQKTFGEILHEIIISKELSSLKDKQQNQTYGFIGLHDLHCVQGCYPEVFLKAWDKFRQQKGSENYRPDFFEKDQIFIILEFEFGGTDLENSDGTLKSLVVAKSILHQVTAAMAVAEQELHFEHRDLHWGNVLVKPTTEKKGSFLLNGAAHSLETSGVLVRIIDYSLSRLEIDDLSVSCDISEDEELFMGQGDYQFDIYRLMRQENGNNWSNYHPHTNVLWLHYLCSKLLSMKYRGAGGRGGKDMRKALTRFHGNILQYSSATEALQNCPMFQ